MKLNINKELLLKHRFWVMVGVTTFLILFGLVYLEFSVDAGDAILQNTKAIQSVGAVKGPFESPATIAKRNEDAKKAIDAETVVWRNAYNAQKSLFPWPQDVETAFQFAEGFFATDININPTTDVKNPKAWPADAEFLMHGTLMEQGETSFKIKARDGKTLQFFTTEATKYVSVTGQPKPLEFNEIGKKFVGKFTAVTFQRGRYFYDKLTQQQREAFAKDYKSQVHEILRMVDPLDENGNGVVQLKEWLFKPAPDFPDEKKLFIRYVGAGPTGADGKDWDTQRDFSREAWIAQENIWIQREIYRIIREANDTIAKFKGQGGDERNKSYKFENSYFELSLSLNAKDQLSFTIKNRLDKRQRIDLGFRVLMNKDAGFSKDVATSEVIRITGLPLMPRGDPSGKDNITQIFDVQKDSSALPRKGVFSVEQILSWETAAVKRIDQISIGSNAGDDGISHSHRTYDTPLTSIKTDDDGPPGGVVPPPTPGGTTPPAGTTTPPRVGVGVKGKGKGPYNIPAQVPGLGGLNGGMLEHGLWKDRYYEVSPQSRRVPVAIVLIVDQIHVDRVLTSFDNSKLRFLPTQVLLNQYSASLQPPPPEESPAPGVAPPGPRPKTAPPPLPIQVAGGGPALETNMELVLYGIMTMYERFPPRPSVKKN